MFFLNPDPSKLYMFIVPIVSSETIGTGFGNFTVEYGLEGNSAFITNGQGGPQVTVVIYFLKSNQEQLIKVGVILRVITSLLPFCQFFGSQNTQITTTFLWVYLPKHITQHLP